MAIIVGTLEVLMSKYQIQYITFLKMVLLVNFCHLYLLFPLSPATFNSIEVISVISRWSVLLGLEIYQPRDKSYHTMLYPVHLDMGRNRPINFSDRKANTT
jgi:hypothetical protein